MKHCIILISCLMLYTGCATFTVNYDFDPEADFTRFQTYAWGIPSETSTISELSAKRIKIAVDKQLLGKGFVSASENPDLLVVIFAGKEKRIDIEEWGYGYDDPSYYDNTWYPGRPPVLPERRNHFEYRRGVDSYEYEVGSLVIDFIDAQKRELVWRGTASGIIDPGKTAEQINEVIARLLANFPPPKTQ